MSLFMLLVEDWVYLAGFTSRLTRTNQIWYRFLLLAADLRGIDQNVPTIRIPQSKRDNQVIFECGNKARYQHF